MIQPLVTGVMVTGKNPERTNLARASVESFLRQTYSNKELLIITDGQTIAPLGVSDRVRQIKLKPGCNLGQLRNTGLALTQKSDLVLQWDDDDVCTCDRIADQVANWQKSGQPTAMLLRNEVLLDLENEHSAPRVITRKGQEFGGFAGSILHKPTTAQYPETGKGEDSDFLSNIVRAGGSVMSYDNKPSLYFRTYHGNNTWDRAHFDELQTADFAWEEYDTRLATAVRWWCKTYGTSPVARRSVAEIAEHIGIMPWCTPGRGYFFGSLIQKHGLKNIVEIGTLHGVSTLYFALGAEKSDGLVTAVDIMRAGHNIPRVEDLLVDSCLEHRVQIVRSNIGSKWLEKWPSNSVDFVYVDGDHRFEGVYYDLQLAHRLLRPGGIMACDDINHPKYPGIRKAWDMLKSQWSGEIKPEPDDRFVVAVK